MTIHPLWWAVVPLGLLVIRACWRKTFPNEREVVELIAFAAGFYASAFMWKKAWAMSEGQEMWVLFTGACVTALASVRGAWECLTRPSPAIPEPEKKNVAP